jgi:hypothetical protein
VYVIKYLTYVHVDDWHRRREIPHGEAVMDMGQNCCNHITVRHGKEETGLTYATVDLNLDVLNKTVWVMNERLGVKCYNFGFDTIELVGIHLCH